MMEGGLSLGNLNALANLLKPADADSESEDEEVHVLYLYEYVMCNDS